MSKAGFWFECYPSSLFSFLLFFFNPSCLVLIHRPALTYLSTEAFARIWNRLRSHEGWCPSSTGKLGVTPFKLIADSKIRYFDMPIISQEQVGWLDVTMNDLLIVHYKGDGKGSFKRCPHIQKKPKSRTLPSLFQWDSGKCPTLESHRLSRFLNSASFLQPF